MPSYLVLHREEFAWPRMSPRAPVRSYFKPLGAAPFHPSPGLNLRSQSEISKQTVAGLFSVALVVAQLLFRNFKFEI
jgi:hypothetical protein